MVAPSMAVTETTSTATHSACCRWRLMSANMFKDVKMAATVQLPTTQGKTVDLGNTSEDTEAKIDLESNRPRIRNGMSCSEHALDIAVYLAGTPAILFATIIGLILWAVIGAVLGPSQTWQIALQNVSSLQCYFSDTLLMRQQHGHFRDIMAFVCELRSRNASCQRMWKAHCEKSTTTPAGVHGQASSMNTGKEVIAVETFQALGDAVSLPPHSLYDRICDPVVFAFSSLYAWVIFWAGIFVWLGFGPHLAWDNDWQLYINSATAVELTFVTIFLQNTRQRHMQYLRDCFALITREDESLERKLREITGDVEPNRPFACAYNYSKETTRGQKMIDYYSAIVGNLIGVAISVVIFAVWIGIGKLMAWNSNWWLIIGTYTGLVGFVDGFTLRNVYFRGSRVIYDHFDELDEEDARLGSLIGVPRQVESTEKAASLLTHFTNTVGQWCASSLAVLASVTTVVAVLVVATAMHWSETGQLICNTPTMIIEGFMLLVLIQAHDTTNVHRRLQFQNALHRRIVMNTHLNKYIVPNSAASATVSAEKGAELRSGRGLGQNEAI